LQPLLGDASAFVFAVALLLAGFSSSVTAAMAGGSIFAGISGEPLDLTDSHSRAGVLLTLFGALLIIFFIRDPFKGIIWSQIILSMQLPLTIFALLILTSSSKVMGRFRNPISHKIPLGLTAAVVSFLNVMLLLSFL
jgi:manganese transport protein